MKFSDIGQDEWDDMKIYFDTCLLPITGMTGAEQPWQATQCLESLRDLLELVEIPFKGRVVTYPAFHYLTAGAEAGAIVRAFCQQARQAGFRYVILATAKESIGDLGQWGGDLVITPNLLADNHPDNPQEVVSQAVRRLWNGA